MLHISLNKPNEILAIFLITISFNCVLLDNLGLTKHSTFRYP